MLAVAAWSLRRPGADVRREEIGHVTVRVEVDEPITVAALALEHGREIAVTRLKREDQPRTRRPCRRPVSRVTRSDLLTIVGPPEPARRRGAARSGHVSSHDIVADRHDLDFRRVTLSTKPLVGHTVGELDLESKFGATVSRVRRGDVDLVAHDTFVLAMGDRLRVIAPDRPDGRGQHLPR